MRKHVRCAMVAIALAGLTLTTAKAQEKKEEEKLSFTLSLNHDAFFGFNPMLSGAYKLSDKAALTFYGIQWGAGTGAAWGNWTEFGLGAAFNAGESITINPQIGFTMGNLLSSFTSGPSVVGDGIVPNVTVNLNSSKMEGQLYAGYYAQLRNEGALGANYVHYWTNLGYKVSPMFSLGGHFEHLFRDGGSNNTKFDQYYTWLGPYVQFSKGIAGLRLSAGANLRDNAANTGGIDFYKLAFFVNL